MISLLVVDDDPVFLDLTCHGLRDTYKVIPATGPKQALQIVKSDPEIDIVISDMQMPEMQGPELLRRISKVSPLTLGVLATPGIAALRTSFFCENQFFTRNGLPSSKWS